MEIYDETGNVHWAVDAVLEHGVAVIHGTTTQAERFGDKIIHCLSPYEDVAAHMGYQEVPNNGYLYYVCDYNRFSTGDESLKKIINQIDEEDYRP